MSNLIELYNCDTPGKLLSALIDSQEVEISFGEIEIASEFEKNLAFEKIKTIINDDTPDRPILLRGVTKSVLKSILVDKLNSNDSLYDGLFLVGEKAKNFLQKRDQIPNPIKYINSVGSEVASWIFECYADMDSAPIDLEYFKTFTNKKAFCKALTDNQGIIDYYLFGLHTEDSENLVNFVSTTLSPRAALNNETTDKLVIFLWLPRSFSLYMNAEVLKKYEKTIIEKNLPVLKDSFYPSEKEFSIKGFIPPHFMLCVHDVGENRVVLNPALLFEKVDWIEDGLNVNQESFLNFIKTTAYFRFLMLTDNINLVEREVSSKD